MIHFNACRFELGKTVVLTIALLALPAAMSAYAAPAPIRVDLKNAQGEKVGTAVITEAKEGVKIAVEASRLSPGPHGIHIHETGTCKGPDFKSAGGHLHMDKQDHGLDNSKGPHSGDLPNLVVGEDGSVKTEMVTARVTLKKGEANSLMKAGGAALVIHAQSDDQKSNPAGNSGDRIVCGEIASAK